MGNVSIIKIPALLILFLLFSMGCSKSKEATNKNQSGSLKELKSTLDRGEDLILNGKHINLKGQTLTVKGSLTIGDKSKISNGSLLGKNGTLICPSGTCFEKVTLKGNWNNESMNLGWFTEGKDPNKNFMAMTNLVAIQMEIFLDKIYPIQANPKTSIDLPFDIRIKGNGMKSSGLILETKHAAGHAYYRTAKGNNIDIQNTSIVTRDFLSQINPIGNDYRLAMCQYSKLYPSAKVKMEYFKIDNCAIKGGVNFGYAVSDKNVSSSEFLNLGIKEITVSNCYIEESVSLLELSNGCYENVTISKNTIKNIYGPTFFFPVGSIADNLSEAVVMEGRDLLVFSSNNVENEKPVKRLRHGYLSPLVAKGKNFKVLDNSIRNILNIGVSTETYPFYCSASNHLLVKGNEVRNIGSKGLALGFGSNSLLKLKGAFKVDVVNNDFQFNKKALVSLGLLKNENASLTSIKPAVFRFSMWGADLLNRKDDGQGYYKFQNNTFSAALVSDYAFISRHEVSLIDNTFDIERLGSSDENKWGENTQVLDHTLFYMREPVTNAVLNIEDNTVTIADSEQDLVYFTRDINDNKDFSTVSYTNNTFNVDATISLAYPRTEILESSNTLNGIGSFTYNRPATSKRNRSIKKLDSDQAIEKYKSSPNGLVHVKNYGKTSISAKSNVDDQVNIIALTFNDIHFYDDIDRLPLSIDLEVDMEMENGQKVNQRYRVLILDKNNLVFKELKSGMKREVVPFWINGKSQFNYEIKPLGNQLAKSVPNLVFTSNAGWNSVNKTGYLILKNMRNVQSFNLTAEVGKLNLETGRNTSSFIEKQISQY